MRLSRSELVGKRRKDKKLGSSRGRKKHKRLDAICEKEYTRNHSGLEKVELSEDNVEGNDTELRRSSRVRRAPMVLDASPAPPKKRRRIDRKSGVNSVDKGKRIVGVKSETLCSTSKTVEDDLVGWRSRLRSRGKCGSFEGEENVDWPMKGRRKLFEDSDEVKEESELEIEEIDDKEEDYGNGDSSAAKLKRLKAFVEIENDNQENDLGGYIGDDKDMDEAEVLASRDEGNGLVVNIENERVNDDGSKSGLGPSELFDKGELKVQFLFNDDGSKDVLGSSESVDKEESEVRKSVKDHGSKDGLGSSEMVDKENLEAQTGLQVEENHGNANAEAVEDNIELEKQENIPGKDQYNAAEMDGALADGQAKDGELLDKPLEDGISEKLRKTNHALDGTLRPLRIKEGRRCGLCGGGTDGRPPKKLVQDGNGSDEEACSGYSASEEPNYDIWDGFGDEPGWLGRLFGPINDRFGIAGIWVHQQCAVWSPEVYFAGFGCLKNVRAALCRGRALKCSRCGRPGATIGCRVDRCPKTYHLPCARATGSIFDHRKFLIACIDHRNLFQPHGSNYLHRLKKLKVKKMKLDVRKMSNDTLRKDIEAEEKWLENCGEDEEFLKRESKRLHRDLLRIAPVYIGGTDCDSGMQFQGWESVAGLQDVIQCMKEVVILPLLYPEFFSNLGLTPPRGVLLHGYPGTGKTLVVRALIGSCSRGDKRIAYFARKGADCLGKYVGDAERQLRLLFQVAEKSQPSIIFFDEIDGLAPCRTRQQDQTHNSVVSTLLALMDGLKSRGSVVVIGATNRPDAVDPALRRPGRFDREIYFPLPSAKDREAILSLHTQKWPKPISDSLLNWIARRTVGFAGADLQALCTQAAIIALRRSFPLHELLSSAGEGVPKKGPPLPSFTVEERDWLKALSSAPPPCSLREAGIAAHNVVSSPLAVHLIPCLLQPLSKLLLSLYLDEHVWLPPSLSRAATLIKNVIISALNNKKAQSDNWWLYFHDLLQEADTLGEIEDSLRCSTLIEDAIGSGDPLEDTADDNYLKFKPSRLQRVGAHPGLLHSISDKSGKKPGFRILISGRPSSGQRHLASCLLHCFVGNVEIQKLDLATTFQEGHGDVVQGMTRILMKCANVAPCMIFLPRIDLWAVETCSYEGQTDCPSSGCSEPGEFAEFPDMHTAVGKASCLWNSFIEQLESICVSTSLMILATSDVPFEDLPSRIRHFFGCEIFNSSLLTPLKDKEPRFLVQVDGNLDHDRAIDTSAAKLSKNLVQYFIHLIHLGNHTYAGSSSEKKGCDNIVGENVDTIHHGLDPGSAVEPVGKYPSAPFTSVALRNPVKVKTNLIMAISTFGYQILCYPHFAELCWVTSKLKEGPFTHLNGTWKGWPFNSCIARPVSSFERVDVACTSNMTKNKKSYVVRGLIAIGLLAYRGEYTSLREVSLEVRKVLELFVGCVNAKIQAGKNKYRFFHLLSQVASLEDMVISWAYTLRSLEMDAQVLEGSPKLIDRLSLNNDATCKESLPGANGCEQNVCRVTVSEQDLLEKNPEEINVQKIGCPDLMADGDPNSPSRGDVVAAVDDTAKQRILDHSAPDVQVESPPQNGMNIETCMPMEDENHTEVGTDLSSIKHSNGFVQRDSTASMEDGPCCLDNKCGSESGEYCNQDTGFLSTVDSFVSENGRKNPSDSTLSMSASLQTDSGVVCMYNCCSQCLVNLHQLLLKILNYEWKPNGSTVTVEDFHDFFATLSASLQSAVRNLIVTDSLSHVSDEKVAESSNGKYSQCLEMCISQSRTSGKRLVTPMECCCHSSSESQTIEPNLLKNSRQRCDMKFIFKDGVLTALDSEYDAAFHCKFKTLCLCSLVKCILISKGP